MLWSQTVTWALCVVWFKTTAQDPQKTSLCEDGGTVGGDRPEGQRDGAVVKRACCSGRGIKFGYQRQKSKKQTKHLLVPASGDPVLSSDLHGNPHSCMQTHACWHTHTCVNTHTHHTLKEEKINPKTLYKKGKWLVLLSGYHTSYYFKAILIFFKTKTIIFKTCLSWLWNKLKPNRQMSLPSTLSLRNKILISSSNI